MFNVGVRMIQASFLCVIFGAIFEGNEPIRESPWGWAAIGFCLLGAALVIYEVWFVKDEDYD